MTERTALRVETGDRPATARDRLTERLVEQWGDDLAVVRGAEAGAAVQDALDDEGLVDDPPSALGPQFAEGTDPKVVLIVLESCHLLIETTRIGTHLKHRVGERLRREGERVEHVTLDEFAERDDES